MRRIFFSFVNCESQWMTSFLALVNFEGERFPSKLVFGEATQVFHGVLFLGVNYRKSCVFFYCSTLSQLFLVFTPYSCQWKDCALGELLIYLGNIIMLIILCYDLYALYFMSRRLSGQNTQNNSCKNVEQ